jgi:hypothetical protein
MKRIFFLSALAIVFIPLIWITYLFYVGNETAIVFIIAAASLTACFALVTIAAVLVQIFSVVSFGVKKIDSPEFRDYLFGKMKEHKDEDID